MEAALRAAEEALLGGRPSLALALLSAASDASTAAGQKEAGSSSAELCRRQQQLQALCRVHLAGPSLESWSKLLGFASPREAASQPAEVRRRYRQLAAAVHPDKCAVPGASQAFQKLQGGVQGLLKGVDSGGAEAGHAAKRRRHNDGLSPLDEEPGETDTLRDEEWFDEAWLASDNDGFAWWSEWDAFTSPPDLPDHPGEQQQHQEGQQPQQAQQPQQGEAEQSLPKVSSAGITQGGRIQHGPCGDRQEVKAPVGSPALAENAGAAPSVGGTGSGASAATAAAAVSSAAAAAPKAAGESEQPEVDDVTQLANLDLEELRTEVQRRQNALLGARSDGGVKPRPSMQELNMRLR
ncbi:hypothetical protein N2152v2_007992 [Parachlorella kessleri]